MKKKVNRYKTSPFKQGTYRPVNRQKYVGVKLPEYRSSWELKFFTWCDRNPNVLEWTSESTIVPYISPLDKRVHRYYVDNTLALKEGSSIKKYMVEIKPYKQTIPPDNNGRKKKSTLLYEHKTYAVNQAKWKAASEYCKDRKWEFVILTEHELKV